MQTIRRILFKSKTSIPVENGMTKDEAINLMVDNSMILCVSEAVSNNGNKSCVLYTPLGNFLVLEDFSDVMDKIGVDFKDERFVTIF